MHEPGAEGVPRLGHVAVATAEAHHQVDRVGDVRRRAGQQTGHPRAEAPVLGGQLPGSDPGVVASCRSPVPCGRRQRAEVAQPRDQVGGGGVDPVRDVASLGLDPCRVGCQCRGARRQRALLRRDLGRVGEQRRRSQHHGQVGDRRGPARLEATPVRLQLVLLAREPIGPCGRHPGGRLGTVQRCRVGRARLAGRAQDLRRLVDTCGVGATARVVGRGGRAAPSSVRAHGGTVGGQSPGRLREGVGLRDQTDPGGPDRRRVAGGVAHVGQPHRWRTGGGGQRCHPAPAAAASVRR